MDIGITHVTSTSRIDMSDWTFPRYGHQAHINKLQSASGSDMSNMRKVAFNFD